MDFRHFERMEYKRILTLGDAGEDSLFLWGARQVGKSTLVKSLFPNAIVYDLLKSDEYERLVRRPALLREELDRSAPGTTVIVDEVQKVPPLLDEVHWLIENRGIRFILCGSSARKLKRVGTNLLGGRALTYKLHPLVSAEIPDFDLLRAINNGLVPRHYMVPSPKKRLQSYIGTYLREEIRDEAIVRQLSSFNRFLEIAAQTDGEIVNYTNIAADCGVSATTVREYFNVLSQTMIGTLVPSFTKSKKRRAVVAPRFYYFDIGIVNYLLHRSHLEPGSADFGHAFEHLIIQEIIAYLDYNDYEDSLSYWRTDGGYEVDAVLGNAKVAIEIKSTDEVQSKHTKGLKAFLEDFPEARPIIVSRDRNPRVQNGIEIVPVLEFLRMLWKGEIYTG